MHLYKRKDSKFWWYKFEMDGVACQGSTKTRNRRDAEGIASDYDLRHTFASRAVEAGVDLVTLAAIMGHSKIQMALRYAHPSEEHQLLTIRKLEEFTIAGQIAETGRSAGAGLIN